MMPNRAFLFWLLDGISAIAMAAAIAGTLVQTAQGATMKALSWSVILGMAAMARAGSQVAASTAGQRDAARQKQDWRARIFAAVLRAPGGSRIMLGEQTADATDRIEDLEGYYARFMPLRLAAVATPLMVAAAAACASWVAAVILLATLVPFAIGMVLAGTAAAKASARQLDALGRLSGLFVDRVRTLPVIVSFGAQERIVRQLADATQQVAERTIEVLRTAFLSSAVLEFFAALSVALVAVYCGFSLLGLLPFAAPEHLTLGSALFVLVLAPEFYLPMRRMAAAYHDKQIGETAMQRLGVAARTDPPVSHVPEDKDTRPALMAPPHLRFDRVVIDYGDRRIGPFSLDVPAGKLTVLSGPSGAGKSSLLNALLSLAPVAEGTIEIAGGPLKPSELQGQTSWSGQTTLLLPGSLRDNIRLARPDAPSRDVEDAAIAAGLDRVIAARCGGLDTPLDSRGSGLSGGERRRIGVARALLRGAPLWLLDEPTADLDAASAARIRKLISDAARGRTVILATHDPEMAALADHHVEIA